MAISCSECQAVYGHADRCSYLDEVMRGDGSTDPFTEIGRRFDKQREQRDIEAMKTFIVDSFTALPRCDAFGKREGETITLPVLTDFGKSVPISPELYAKLYVEKSGLADKTDAELKAICFGTPAEHLKSAEDLAAELMDGRPRSALLIVYKLMHAQGVRISSIDHVIKTALKKEEENS